MIEDPLSDIRVRYARRAEPGRGAKPVNKQLISERQRVIAAFLRALRPLHARTLLEIGAAAGSNVPYFLDLGFLPDHIVINDIRPEALAGATHWTRLGVRAVAGDAAELDFPPFDVVFAATVFTSILSTQHRQQIARAMWRLTKHEGGVLLYDFTYNNPVNPDVRKLPLNEIRALFPGVPVRARRVTLAPPIARRIPAWVYPILNVPWLRTHLVTWIPKC